MSLPETTISPKTTPTVVDGKISKTAGYYTAFVALGLITASLGPTLPGLAEHTQTKLSEISYLFTAKSLGYLCGSFLGGRLYDRLPGHLVMAAALIVIAATMALAPLMPWLWLLTAVVLMLGLAEGGLDLGGNALLVWVHRREVGPFMNGLHFFFGVGAFLSPIIIAQAVSISGDITWAYWLLALLMVPPAAWLFRLPSPPAQTISKADPAAQANPLLIALIALFFFLFVAAEASFGGWLFTYAVRLNLADETTAAYLTSAYWGALTLGRLLAIPIAARFRPRAILVANLTGCLASLAILLGWSDSLAATWVGTFGVGLSLASMFPTTFSLAERRMAITGRVAAWFFVGISTGAMSVPWLIGQFFEAAGPRIMLWILTLDLLIAVGILAILTSTKARFTAP